MSWAHNNSLNSNKRALACDYVIRFVISMCSFGHKHTDTHIQTHTRYGFGNLSIFLRDYVKLKSVIVAISRNKYSIRGRVFIFAMTHSHLKLTRCARARVSCYKIICSNTPAKCLNANVSKINNIDRVINKLHIITRSFWCWFRFQKTKKFHISSNCFHISNWDLEINSIQ